MNSAVRALPTCSCPVGLGAKRSLIRLQATGKGSGSKSSGLFRRDRHNSATAWTAIDSPAPIESTPSLVLPFTLTCDASQSSAPARLRANRVDVRRQLRLLRDDDDVDVDDRIARVVHDGHRAPQQLDAVGVLPGRIGVGKVTADVARARGAEHRVGHRMADRVGVGVRRAAPSRTGSSRRQESAAGRSRVDAGRSRCRCASQRTPATRPPSRRSAIARSSGVVIFRFRGSPSTTRTLVTRLLGEHRFVGGVAAERQRVPQHRASKRLRRLREIDLLARQRRRHDAVRVRALDGVVRRESRRSRHRIRPPQQPFARSSRPSQAAARRRESRRRPRDPRRAQTHGPLSHDDVHPRPRFRRACRPARSDGGGSSPSSAGSATTMSSITSQPRNTSTLRSRIDRPPSNRSCLGCVPPKRRPRPPAAMRAETCTGRVFS